MTRDRARRLRDRTLLAVECVVAALLLVAAGVAGASRAVPGDVAVDAREPAQITVMTRNLYVGTGMGEVFAATSAAELVNAGTRAWASLQATDFPTRAEALADEIVQAGPDVVGLQEVTLWRDQTPGDVLTRPGPDATHVVLDFLAVLQDALRARGVPYTEVATSTGADVEFPRQDAAGGTVDLRLTDRDVLLVRADRATRAGHPRDGRYAAQFSEPFLNAPVASTRGWTSIDYRLDPATTVRVLSTHLEVGEPVTGTTQQQQADEYLALAAASPHPVIALGDYNSPADGSGTPTYQRLTAALGDVWAAARPADPGLTCCQIPPLADPVGSEVWRLDLVLVSPGLQVAGAARTGDRPFRTTPAPVWASDHFGVTARIVVPRR
jgi:endonuclease/exonuclease/phosphatase family metal-dependent hydrolase